MACAIWYRLPWSIIGVSDIFESFIIEVACGPWSFSLIPLLALHRSAEGDYLSSLYTLYNRHFLFVGILLCNDEASLNANSRQDYNCQTPYGVAASKEMSSLRLWCRASTNFWVPICFPIVDCALLVGHLVLQFLSISCFLWLFFPVGTQLISCRLFLLYHV